MSLAKEKVERWFSVARHGPFMLAVQLLKENPNLIAAIAMVNDAYQTSALHWATTHSNLEVMKLLLKENVGLTKAIDGVGRTALHLAASSRERASAVPLLLAADPASLHVLDLMNQTPLDAAMLSRDVAVMAQFFTADPSLTHRAIDSGGRTVLHIAAGRNFPEGVATLLKQHPSLINAFDNEGGTALHTAATYGYSEVMTQLLAVASPRVINAVCPAGTALRCAAFRGHFDIVEQLLDVTSPELISAVDNLGKTVLSYAASDGEAKTVARLAAMSPGLIDKVTPSGETVLHMGAGHESVAQMLLALRPEMVHAVDNNGNTILHFAEGSICRPSKEHLERLMALIPSAVHAVNSKGQTPFALAVRALPRHRESQTTVAALLAKLSLEEAVSVFTEHKTRNYQAQFLLPVLERQCKPLWDVLNQDVARVVFEYLGLDSRHIKF